MRERRAPLGWRRLAGLPLTLALTLMVLAAAAETTGAVESGRLAGGSADAPWRLVAALAVLLVGAGLLDAIGATVASGLIGRAEHALRVDLLDAALGQPLPVLQEQAVGEVIDRVDDDVTQSGRLLRTTGVSIVRAAFRSVLAWLVAGATWAGAWLLFPLVAVAALLVARPTARLVAARKLAEEVAWSEHAAQLEEAVAGRDDVRTALGQAHVLRQYAARAQGLLARVRATTYASSTTTLRTSSVLQGLLALLAVAGVALVSRGALPVAGLVTIWLLASSFVGQLNQVAHHLPEIQAGLGALTRIRSLLEAPQEPVGGSPMPEASATVEFRDLTFAFADDDVAGPTFALRGVSLVVPAGTTCALVGRTGSGKSTLTSFVSRALEPPARTVFVAGQDVRDTDLEALRRGVGVVTQRTELLDATLLENVTLFADVDRTSVTAAFSALELDDWVAGLPAGLDTPLGGAGVMLSAGEQQLVAFARLLVREVRVVVLDEATARMDPETERLVGRAAERLLAGRTGLLVAHRLATTARCDTVAVLDGGRLVQHGPRGELAARPGPFRDLLVAAGAEPPSTTVGAPLTRTERRRDPRPVAAVRPGLVRTLVRLLTTHKRWGLLGSVGFGLTTLIGVSGAVTGWLWGRLVADLDAGGAPWLDSVLLVACVACGPWALWYAVRIYPLWWSGVTLRMRLAVLHGQTMQHRLEATAPGEVTARALDSDRLVWYADRWVDVALATITVAATALLSRSLLALAVVGGVLLLSALVSTAGAPLAGRAAREAGDQRALFGRSLASCLEAVRTVKLAGATRAVKRHLREVDERRIHAHIREYRVRTLLNGVPQVLLQAGVVVAWAAYAAGTWGVATALLVTTTVSGFGWFGIVMAAAVTEAPVARRWLRAASQLAGTPDLVSLPPGVDLVAGSAPAPGAPGRVPLRRLQLQALTAVHDDGTVGVEEVDLTVDRGDVVLLAGRVGSGKSSLLRSLAGLVDHEGRILWNGEEVTGAQTFLRPGQVAYVGQVPRVLSVSFRDNVTLDHDRAVDLAFETARLHQDLAAAGGDGVLVGHRGVRLSGGQVQRLALARALATEAELLVADDVSSALDARTELELWEGLRRRGTTVIGTSSKRSALAGADLVVVLEDGRVVDQGPWRELSARWGHLAG